MSKLRESRPALLVPSPHGALLVNDGGDAFLADPTRPRAPDPLPDLAGCAAAAVGPDGTLIAVWYAPAVASLGAGGWETRALSAPALAVAATPTGVAVGDAGGTVTLLPTAGVVRFDHPAVGVCAADAGLVALGPGGAVGRAAWGDAAFALAEVGDVTPVGLFPTGPRTVGLICGDRLALLDVGTGRVSVGRQAFPAGVRAVVGFDGGFGVLTDAGELVLLDADLSAGRPVALPGDGSVVDGVCRNPAGGLLAWTTDGVLLAVSRDRTVRTVAADGVVLAAPAADVVVAWWTGGTVRVGTVRV